MGIQQRKEVKMTYRDPDHVHEPVREPDAGTGLTAFALVKYTFILAIVIVVLYFIARYLLPLFTG
jgi:cell division septal protein FtsQ